ncbi:hypothetical protein ACGFYQ_22390 [Streptomyces sp. NPDC048258]|uniref:hypothetical protein n=1 Tax=Streptomyces sp. NPDC048258 TaxID=3365527 RepID=UPI003714D27C
MATVLLTAGPTALVGGGWVALDIRGSAAWPARRGEADAELRRHSQGDLGPATRTVSAGVIRHLATFMALGGVAFTLGGLLELP